jgi:hypothetical protein
VRGTRRCPRNVPDLVIEYSGRANNRRKGHLVIRGAVGFLITAVAISASLMLLRLTPATTDWFIKEDGPIEDFGAICLFGASAFVVLALFHLRRAKVSRIKLASYACCALFLFIAGGEEISWGQRFLGIQTPQIIAKINVQGEINLHNLYGNEHGQNMSVIIFRMFWFVLGVALPLAASWRPLRRQLERYLPLFPFWLAFAFIYQQLLWRPVEALWMHDPGSWTGTYPYGDVGSTQRIRITTPAEALAGHDRAPAGMSELMEANVEMLLLVGAVCLFLAARRVRAREDGGFEPLQPRS